MRPARLSGFKRMPVLLCDYTAIVQHDESTVDGYFLDLETVAQRKKLDHFEGEFYRLLAVNVNLLDSDRLPIEKTIEADMYVWDGEMDVLFSEP